MSKSHNLFLFRSNSSSQLRLQHISFIPRSLSIPPKVGVRLYCLTTNIYNVGDQRITNGFAPLSSLASSHLCIGGTIPTAMIPCSPSPRFKSTMSRIFTKVAQCRSIYSLLVAFFGHWILFSWCWWFSLGVWEVQARWLTDLQKFNEFMNEEDYEVEDDKHVIFKPQKFA